MINFNREVFCPTCLKFTKIDLSGKFQCSNPHCFSPYYFRLFDNKKKALAFYNTIESWRPKSYFTRNQQWLVSYFNDPIKPLIITKLSDVVDSQVLRILECGISDELEYATTILEADGGRIDTLEALEHDETAKYPKNCCPYCIKIRTTKFHCKSGNQICEAFDRQILEKFNKNEIKKEAWYICWAGLVDYTVPIEVEGIFLGLVFSGQLRLKGIDRNGRQGDKILLDGVKEASDQLSIDFEELKKIAFSSEIPGATPYQIENKFLPRLKKVASIVQNLAYESYRIKRREIEDLFLEEIAYQIEYGKEDLSEFHRLKKVLSRLCDFFYLEQCYFLFTYKQDRSCYEIMNKGRGDFLTESEVEFILNIKEEQLERTNVSLVRLTRDRFPDAYAQLENLLLTQKDISKSINIYIGTCPLPGTFNGYWVFINPMIEKGLRNRDVLTKLDQDFLTRFCVTARERIDNIFSSHILLRKIGHELGTSIQAVLSGEQTIINNVDDKELVLSTAQHNITELTKYHFIKENLSSIFIRGDRSSYFFERNNLKALIRNICNLLKDEAEKDYNVIIEEPILRDNGWIEMSYDHLRIAFFNLIQNAIKYSFKGHYVKITGWESFEDKNYTVEISNFGVGITKEELSDRLIFQEGYRGILSCDRNRSGNGLGLAIADQIIKNHLGSIQANSYSALELQVRKNQIQYQHQNQLDIPPITEDGQLRCGFLSIFKIFLPIIQD